MISHKHKAIFVHVPKTAGSSMRMYFGKRGFGPVEYHAPDGSNDDITGVYVNGTAWRIKRNLLNVWDDYFKFAFVRNPWDRFASNYFFLINEFEKEQNNPTGVHPQDFLDKAKHIASFGSFKKMVMDGTVLHNVPTQYGILKINDSVGVDFIGKTENLQEDFNIICDKIGIPPQQLPHKNKTKHKHYTEYYNDETKQIVAEKYAKDIEHFGYEFGE